MEKWQGFARYYLNKVFKKTLQVEFVLLFGRQAIKMARNRQVRNRKSKVAMQDALGKEGRFSK